MKLYGYMLSAAIGYTVGTRMGLMRRCATRSMKQMKRILCISPIRVPTV